MKINIKELWILSVCILLIIGIVTWKTPDPDILSYIIDLAISILATIITVFAITQKLDMDDFKKGLRESIMNYNDGHFYRVDTNKGMGEKFWKDLILDMDSVSDPVWFIGKEMKLWLTSASYKRELESKLCGRINKAVKSPPENHITYILFTDSTAEQPWTKFVEKTIEKAFQVYTDRTIGPKMKKLDFINKAKNKICIKHIDRSKVKHSVVWCGNRMVITMHNSNGEKSEDSPTMDIRHTSSIRSFFEDDINSLRDTLD
jgi:hypothetical protein